MLQINSTVKLLKINFIYITHALKSTKTTFQLGLVNYEKKFEISTIPLFYITNE